MPLFGLVLLSDRRKATRGHVFNAELCCLSELSHSLARETKKKSARLGSQRTTILNLYTHSHRVCIKPSIFLVGSNFKLSALVRHYFTPPVFSDEFCNFRLTYCFSMFFIIDIFLSASERHIKSPAILNFILNNVVD